MLYQEGRDPASPCTHLTTFDCHQSSVPVPRLSVIAEVNIKAISLGCVRRRSPPFVHVQSSAKKQWWNPDGLSVFWSVLFSLPIHFSSLCSAMHHVCPSILLPLSVSPPLPAFSVPHFSEGWLQRMNAQVTARRNYGNAAPVISDRCRKLYGNAQQPTTGSF